MSAEVPTPALDKMSPRPSLLGSNRGQMLLFALLTLILTVATVWGGRIWLRNSETLSFAVGDANGPEARFAGAPARRAVMGVASTPGAVVESQGCPSAAAWCHPPRLREYVG